MTNCKLSPRVVILLSRAHAELLIKKIRENETIYPEIIRSLAELSNST